MQRLDWNDLQVFLAIAEAGQISRAGQALQLDATTMGRRLRRLEQRLLLCQPLLDALALRHQLLTLTAAPLPPSIHLCQQARLVPLLPLQASNLLRVCAVVPIRRGQ